MADETQVSTTEAPVTQEPWAAPAPEGTGPIDFREAGRSLINSRNKRDAAMARQARGEPEPEAKEPIDKSQAETVEKEPALEADAAPPAPEATGETEEAAPEPEKVSPLSPPRSWSKDKAESWSKLDRDTQQYLLDHDSNTSSAVRKAQNEAAEIRKGLEAERNQVAQARERYETALPALLQTLQEQQAGEFSDIKTMADVERLSREDWPRYIQWDAQQKKLAAVQQEVKSAQSRREQEFNTQWGQFAEKEDALFVEKIPELANKELAQKAGNAAIEVLKGKGFTDSELNKLWNGQASVSLRDHRVQDIIYDAMRYREAKSKTLEAPKKPLPPVQKPGVAQPKGAAGEAALQALQARLDKTGSLKDAAALTREKRRLASRQ